MTDFSLMNSNGEARSSKVEEDLKKLSLESSSSFLLKFKTNDGEVFEVQEVVMLQSETIKSLIQENTRMVESEITLADISGKIFEMVLNYCKKHADDETLNVEQKQILTNWDTEFIDLEKILLFDVLKAASFLNIRGLLNLGCRKVGEMIKGKNVEQVREMFGIVSDFTSEEEDELKDKDRWMRN